MATAIQSISSRRTALRAMAVTGSVAVLLSLTGCGFALRQAPKFAFDSVRVTGLENTSMSRALQQAMLASGIQVVNSSAAAATNPAATSQSGGSQCHPGPSTSAWWPGRTRRVRFAS